MTEKGKERLKKLGKIALGLGALGAAGAGTYYAAKNGMLGATAQNLVDHGSTNSNTAAQQQQANQQQAQEKLQDGVLGDAGKSLAVGTGATAAGAGIAYGGKKLHDKLIGDAGKRTKIPGLEQAGLRNTDVVLGRQSSNPAPVNPNVTEYQMIKSQYPNASPKELRRMLTAFSRGHLKIPNLGKYGSNRSLYESIISEMFSH